VARNNRQDRRNAGSVGMCRRQFLHRAAATGGVLTFGGLSSIPRVLAQDVTLPPPDGSGIDHIIVLMMENRTFDHMLGWVEGADGRQRGLTYFYAAGTPHRTYRLAPDFLDDAVKRARAGQIVGPAKVDFPVATGLEQVDPVGVAGEIALYGDDLSVKALWRVHQLTNGQRFGRRRSRPHEPRRNDRRRNELQSVGAPAQAAAV